MSKNISSSCFSRFVLVIFLAALFVTPSFSENPQTTQGNATAAAGADPLVEKGKGVFKSAGCATCHSLHQKKTGPALKGAFDRWGKNEARMKGFIKSPGATIAKGDPRATAVYADFKSAGIMPNHDFLTDEDLTAVIAYIKAAPEEEGPKKVNPEGGPQVVAKGENNQGLILTLIIVVLILVLVALSLVLVFIRRYLKDKEATLREDEKYIVNQKFEFGTFFRSQGFIGTVVFIFICVAARGCYMGLMSVGVEQNYEPKQPIPFSHKVHAGQYKIDCNYCHTGVTKGKQANIPSINICMNCHSQIQEGKLYGKEAIGVLLDSYKKQRPIEWVRVHNLPDLAYFNHAQHVVAGQVECTTCHGPIDSMDVVRQHSPLTMGWCVNCHRQTEVKLDNAYYLKNPVYKKMFDKHEKVTVENIGGLECSKCHF